jgi:16S rRNA (cytidine1402-2'-O)-methyltransferase
MNNIMELLPAALKATAGQTWATPALYIVATPIGNLADISARALACLQLADVVAAEDTRMAQKLFAAYGMAPKPLVRCDAHTELAASARLIAELAAGKRVALVSDAGTPAVSDPGARVVAAVRAAGYPVVPLPGASAVLALLSAAGIDGTAFSFVGFAPTQASEFTAWLAALEAAQTTTVFFEAPQAKR